MATPGPWLPGECTPGKDRRAVRQSLPDVPALTHEGNASYHMEELNESIKHPYRPAPICASARYGCLPVVGRGRQPAKTGRKMGFGFLRPLYHPGRRTALLGFDTPVATSDGFIYNMRLTCSEGRLCPHRLLSIGRDGLAHCRAWGRRPPRGGESGRGSYVRERGNGRFAQKWLFKKKNILQTMLISLLKYDIITT